MWCTVSDAAPLEAVRTVASSPKLFGVSRNTIYKYVFEPKGGRTVIAADATPALPAPATPSE